MRVEAMMDIGSNIREEYPLRFQGLRNFGEEYDKPDANHTTYVHQDLCHYLYVRKYMNS